MLLILVIFLAVVLAAGVWIRTHDVAVLDPHGIVASRQRRLIIEATLLMLIVVVPVYILTFWIAWRYREDNKNARYEPDWDGNRGLEILWWAIPALIITILGVITYRSSHQLDPFKPLASNIKPLNIEVVALQWKWLFIYPDQNIASVNFVQFPLNRPVTFYITSDAPMNSFWIPQLGGQIYAMSGMSTQLHLMADTTGSFHGLSANISGRGFAGMEFTAKASSAADFSDWVTTSKKTGDTLNSSTYEQLARPTTNNPVSYYGYAQGGLYDQVLHKYNRPAPAAPSVDYHVASLGVE